MGKGRHGKKMRPLEILYQEMLRETGEESGEATTPTSSVKKRGGERKRKREDCPLQVKHEEMEREQSGTPSPPKSRTPSPPQSGSFPQPQSNFLQAYKIPKKKAKVETTRS